MKMCANDQVKSNMDRIDGVKKLNKLDRLIESMITTEGSLKSAKISVDLLASECKVMESREAEMTCVAVLESLSKCMDDISNSLDYIIRHPEYKEGEFHDLCMNNYERCQAMYNRVRGMWCGSWS